MDNSAPSQRTVGIIHLGYGALASSHPLLSARVNGKSLAQIMVERCASAFEAEDQLFWFPSRSKSRFVAQSKTPVGPLEGVITAPPQNWIDDATCRIPCSPTFAVGEDDETVGILREFAARFEYVVLTDCRFPFLSEKLCRAALAFARSNRRIQLTISNKLSSLSPVAIVRGSHFTTVVPHAIPNPIVKNWAKNLPPVDRHANKSTSANRYFYDRYSLTPTGEFYDDVWSDFRRIFDKWTCTNENQLRSIMDRVAELGGIEPNDDLLDVAILTDMARNRRIIRGAIESGAKGTREMREANLALSRWEARNGIPRPESFPHKVWMAITDVCNARCTFCKYHPDLVDYRAVDLELIKKCDWLRFAKEFWFHYGLGEPLAYPQFAELMEHCREHFPFLELKTATNASLLNERNRRAILGYMQQITVSFNAATKETYEKVMPPLKWNTVVGNLRKLKEEKRAVGIELPLVSLSYVVHIDCIDELPLLPELAADLGAHRIAVTHYHWKVVEQRPELLPKTHSLFYHQERYDTKILETAERCAQFGVMLSAPPPFNPKYRSHAAAIPAWAVDIADDNEGEPDIEANASPVGPEFGYQSGDNTCFHPWTRIYIHPQRSFYEICCTMGPSIGRYTWPNSQSFHADIWHSPILQSVRYRQNREGEVPVPCCKFCKDCNKRDPGQRPAWSVAVARQAALFSEWEAKPAR